MDNEIMVYIPELGVFMMVAEGDGCNLDQEWTDNGFVDYTYIEIYQYDDRELVEVDGGQLMHLKPFTELYPKVEDCLEDAMNFMYNKVYDYIIIKNHKEQ